MERLAPYLSSLGITRVANVTGLDYLGISVVMAVRPNSYNLSVYQGKGVTLDAARASAVMEAYEHAPVLRNRARTSFGHPPRHGTVVLPSTVLRGVGYPVISEFHGLWERICFPVKPF